MKKTGFELYKRLVIKWYEGGSSYKHYNEVMIITKNKISFKRGVDCKEEPTDSFDTCKWIFKIEDDSFSSNFYNLCMALTNIHNEVEYFESNIGWFSFELVLDDNTKIKENFFGDMKRNGFNEIIKLIKEFIPKSLSKPYFLG